MERPVSLQAGASSGHPLVAQRLPGIDMVRAVAALAVLASHLPFFAGGAPSGPGTTVWRVHVVQGSLGAWGVRLFFVLSGLCIHLPLARRLAVDAGAPLEKSVYFRRRFTRIYPPHLIVLVASALAGLVLPSAVLPSTPLTRPTVTQFLLHVFMVHSFVPSAVNSINAVLWSIAVETHFYLLYPVLLILRRRYGIARTTLFLFCVSCISRGVGWLSTEDVRTVLETNVVCSYWEWSLGCVIAERLVKDGAPAKHGFRAFAVSCVGSFSFAIAMKLVCRLLFGADLGRDVASEALGLLGPPLFAVVVYLACGLHLDQRKVARAWLVRVGLESYSLYLTHPITIAVLCYALYMIRVPLGVPVAVVAGAASILAAKLFYHFVEYRFAARAARVRGTPSVTSIIEPG